MKTGNEEFDNIVNSPEFMRKGQSRLFVLNPEDVAVVDAVIKEIDDWEYDYLGTDMIVVYNPKGHNNLVYNGKFDMDVPTIVEKCLERGVVVKIVSYSDLQLENL